MSELRKLAAHLAMALNDFSNGVPLLGTTLSGPTTTGLITENPDGSIDIAAGEGDAIWDDDVADPYDPYQYDRGIKVSLAKFSGGTDPSHPSKGRHLEIDVLLSGVRYWEGLGGPGGFNAFQFSVEVPPVLMGTEMVIDFSRSVAKGKLRIQDDDVPGKEVVGGSASGKAENIVYSDGILVRLAWYRIPEGPPALIFPSDLFLRELSISHTLSGILINGVNRRVPIQPEHPDMGTTITI